MCAEPTARSSPRAGTVPDQETPAPPPGLEEGESKRWGRRFLLFGAGTVLLGFYLESLDFEALTGAIREFPFLVAAGVVVLNLFPGMLKYYRWRYLLSARGLQARGFRGYLAVNASFYLGLVTPGTAGELSRAFVAESSEVGRATAVVAFEKLADFVVLGLLVVLSGAVQFTGGLESWLVVFGTAAGIVGGYLVFLRFDRLFTTPLKLLLERVVSDVQKRSLRESYWEFYELIEDRKLTAFSLLVSGALWIVTLVQMQLIFVGFGWGVPLKTTALILFLPYLLGVVSLIPLGLGVFEWTMSRATELAVAGGGIAGAGATPLVFRLLVTVPLVLGGYLCHLGLALDGERPR